MMVYVAFFDLEFPQNLKFFFNLLIGIINADLLPSEKMDHWFFQFNGNMEPFSDNFNAANIF